LQICRVIKKVDRAVTEVYGTCSYLLLQKNGVEVGQSVPHVHVHYIPWQKGDDSIMKFFMRMFQSKMHIISAQEMKENVEKLQAAIN
jgi:diadenosine tetraphosphate (Ap4A) HIT family hydrolase